MTIRKPCLACGALGTGSYCDKHILPRHRPLSDAKREHRKRLYSGSWRALSERARKLQPFCSICGHRGSPDNPLTGEHTERAMQAIAAGKTVTLAMVDVLCLKHNSERRWQRELPDNS